MPKQGIARRRISTVSFHRKAERQAQRPRRWASTGPIRSGRAPDHPKRDLKSLTARFRNALRKGVEGIIEAGRVLIEAKDELDHGKFMKWVVRELRFGERRPGDRAVSIRKADMLMFLARNAVISNPQHWHALPPSPRTLWELTQIRPTRRLLDLIATGKVYLGMTREEAIALRRGASNRRSPVPKLKPQIAALLEVCILLGGGDGVLAHLRGLTDMGDVPPAAVVDQAARWMKRELAERRRAK
jgi:hypothetical protein